MTDIIQHVGNSGHDAVYLPIAMDEISFLSRLRLPEAVIAQHRHWLFDYSDVRESTGKPPRHLQRRRCRWPPGSADGQRARRSGANSGESPREPQIVSIDITAAYNDRDHTGTAQVTLWARQAKMVDNV